MSRLKKQKRRPCEGERGHAWIYGKAEKVIQERTCSRCGRTDYRINPVINVELPPE